MKHNENNINRLEFVKLSHTNLVLRILIIYTERQCVLLLIDLIKKKNNNLLTFTIKT